jgi:hypothetical protein
MLFEAFVVCPYCGYQCHLFFQRSAAPQRGDMFEFVCPQNASKIWFFAVAPRPKDAHEGWPLASRLQAVNTVSVGAVQARELPPDAYLRKQANCSAQAQRPLQAPVTMRPVDYITALVVAAVIMGAFAAAIVCLDLHK